MKNSLKLSRNLKLAMAATDWTRTNIRLFKQSVIPSDVTASALDIVQSRTPHGPTERYPLFGLGYDPEQFINKVVGDGSNGSECLRTFDLPNLRKVGPQGASFPIPYLWEKSTSKYFSSVIREDGLTERQRLIVEQVGNDLVARVGVLTPLSWEEAVDVACGDAQAWPFGGQKSDPMTRKWLLEHPWELGNSALVGQRYQRNKTDEDGCPVPRSTFNSDVRTVVATAAFTYPLIRALQADAKRDYSSPYQGLNGPEAVGAAIYDYLKEKPNMAFTSVMGDVTGMDQCCTLWHVESIMEPVLRRIYPSEWHELLHATLVDGVMCDLVLDADHVLCGPHSWLSGIGWTQLGEDIITLCVAYDFLTAVVVTTKGAKDPVYRGLEEWKPALIHVQGDDVHVLVSVPAGVTYYRYSDLSPVSLEELYAELYEAWDLRAAVQKQHVWFNRTSFCSKLYKPSCTAVQNGRSYLRPIYSVVMALNNVFYPEYSCTDPSMPAEVSRVAQIMDDVVGHECYDKAVTFLFQSLTEGDKVKLREMLLGDRMIFDASQFAYTCRAYMYHSWEEWKPTTSPTLALFAKLSGMTADEIVNAQKVLNDIHSLRRLHWRYHVNPASVLDPSSPDSLSALRYRAFFDASYEIDPTDNSGRSNDAFDVVQAALHTDCEGRVVAVRKAEEYLPTLTWLQNWLSDTPASDMQEKKTFVKSQNQSENAVNGAKRNPRFRF